MNRIQRQTGVKGKSMSERYQAFMKYHSLKWMIANWKACLLGIWHYIWLVFYFRFRPSSSLFYVLCRHKSGKATRLWDSLSSFSCPEKTSASISSQLMKRGKLKAAASFDQCIWHHINPFRLGKHFWFSLVGYLFRHLKVLLIFKCLACLMWWCYFMWNIMRQDQIRKLALGPCGLS